MERQEYVRLFAIEESHWWFRGMERITLSLLTNLYPGQPRLSVLDAGCGTGAAMKYLARFGAVTGCEISALALDFCRERDLSRLNQASVTSLPFGDNSFDLVTSFDVLYHRAVADHHRALAEFHRVLRPGGRLLVRVPAYNWLHRRHDVATHTARRLTAGDMRRDLQAAGLTIEKVSYANVMSLPAAMVQSVVEKALPDSGRSDLESRFCRPEALLRGLLYVEARWLVHHCLPFGLSVMGVGKKQGEE